MRRFAFVIAAGAAAILVGSPAISQEAQAVSTGRAVGSGAQDSVSQRTQSDALNDITRSGGAQKPTNTTHAKKEHARAAKATEIVAGSIVNDSAGEQLATIEGVEADGAILITGTAKVKVPLEAFGLNSKGLMLDVTKTQFESLVASANAPAKS